MADSEVAATGCERLVRLVAPPAEPVDASGDWAAVQDEIGGRLPADYRRLVETYGWGEFCDFLYLRTPFGTSRHNGIERQVADLSSPAPSVRECGCHPHSSHPAPGAGPAELLIWGTTMDADRLCWLTGGAPDEWPVVVWSSEGRHETHQMGAAHFLAGWVGGHVGSHLLADMEPDLAPWFNTFRPRTHRCLRLSEGPRVAAECLRILREALAPTVDRGSWFSEDGEWGQDHFATVDTDWHLTYEADRPHRIRIAFPPEDGEPVRQRVFAAVARMGCEVLQVTTAVGTPLAAWNAPTDEDRSA
ncbi:MULTISPECIES: SMI1/KNR4 family protein [unclassified Streptomyces]|uniref:SMI1/KNR4 family protein n=1 Tax=unclassified Streptomyces TaxID=2593676 RepID=UPI0003644315|nr:SMI1/KNR4 family protein [Streptomyces sp. 303MFCol5.2]